MGEFLKSRIRQFSGDPDVIADMLFEETIAFDEVDPAVRQAVELALSMRIARQRNKAPERLATRLKEDAARSKAQGRTPRDANAWAERFNKE